MRGYFAIGVESIHKTMNVGSLLRTAHAFGASFMFTVSAAYDKKKGRLSDTSSAIKHIPFYEFPDVDSLILPSHCTLVGVEITEDATELPSFNHPSCAAYILGPERGQLSEKILKKCTFSVKIPTRFCINVGLAGALVMYDRLISKQRFASRPLTPGGPKTPLSEHVHGAPFLRKIKKYQAAPWQIK